MRLADFLDKGASLHSSGAPCLTIGGRSRRHADVQRPPWLAGRAPAEAGQALLAHPAVLDCAVAGLPGDKWGERVTAVLQLRPGHEVTAAEVKRPGRR